jgi:recombination protein RecT
MTSTDVVRQQVNEAALAGGTDQPTVFDLIKRQQPAIEMALPAHLSGDRFTRIALTLIRKTPKLLECEPMSFVGALMVSAQLGLEPGPPLGLSWIVPYYNKNTRKLEAEFQMGYKGIIKLFQQSGQFRSIKARTVHQNDEFSFDDGLNDELVHRWKLDEDRGPAIAYYAIAKFLNGGHEFIILSKADVEKRRARGQNGPAWRTDYDAMGMKSAIRALAPWLPLSPELERALAGDERTYSEIKPDMLADLPELEAGDDADLEVEDVTDVEPETVAPAAAITDAFDPGPPHSWSADQWKPFLKAHGVTQAHAIKHAESLQSEFGLGGAPVTSLDQLRGQERLCELFHGWVEEQGS